MAGRRESPLSAKPLIAVRRKGNGRPYDGEGTGRRPGLGCRTGEDWKEPAQVTG
ncbi:hypothetical protein [Streptomyces sp. NPDC093544]|uniref:hypothetical protein n=1 Tax=Streptomyces sp. NPDC093544 TaxID=3155200 RepID=UPI00344138CB